MFTCVFFNKYFLSFCLISTVLSAILYRVWLWLYIKKRGVYEFIITNDFTGNWICYVNQRC